MKAGRISIVVSGVLCTGWLLSSAAGAAPIGAATGAAAGGIETAGAAGAGVPLVKVQHWHHHHHHGGAGIAAGIAAGALFGAMAAQPARPAVSPDAVAYCARRYRSYDPQSMTYLGRDGYRHPCP